MAQKKFIISKDTTVNISTSYTGLPVTWKVYGYTKTETDSESGTKTEVEYTWVSLANSLTYGDHTFTPTDTYSKYTSDTINKYPLSLYAGVKDNTTLTGFSVIVNGKTFENKASHNSAYRWKNEESYALANAEVGTTYSGFITLEAAK